MRSPTGLVDDGSPQPYLAKGVSTDDFSEALSALLGPDSPGLSATTITRLVSVWQEEHREWSKWSLDGRERERGVSIDRRHHGFERHIAYVEAAGRPHADDGQPTACC